MTGRDTPRGPDPDDWFADSERGGSRRERSSAQTVRTSAVEDDWIGDDPGARRESSLLAALPEGWAPLAAGAVLVLVLLVGGLALAGVFSSSKAKPEVTTIPTLPTTAPTTTAATPAVVVPAPTTTLKPGDTGAEVKVLQRALDHLGYTVGTIDGDYGTATKTAVAQFQTASNLTADGVFGPDTRTALVAALNAG